MVKMRTCQCDDKTLQVLVNGERVVVNVEAV